MAACGMQHVPTLRMGVLPFPCTGGGCQGASGDPGCARPCHQQGRRRRRRRGIVRAGGCRTRHACRGPARSCAGTPCRLRAHASRRVAPSHELLAAMRQRMAWPFIHASWRHPWPTSPHAHAAPQAVHPGGAGARKRARGGSGAHARQHAQGGRRAEHGERGRARARASVVRRLLYATGAAPTCRNTCFKPAHPRCSVASTT